jgi:hypothetical protein
MEKIGAMGFEKHARAMRMVNKGGKGDSDRFKLAKKAEAE